VSQSLWQAPVSALDAVAVFGMARVEADGGWSVRRAMVAP
jgi:hypothetical protein